jgi:hypothetical protein
LACEKEKQQLRSPKQNNLEDKYADNDCIDFAAEFSNNPSLNN